MNIPLQFDEIVTPSIIDSVPVNTSLKTSYLTFDTSADLSLVIVNIIEKPQFGSLRKTGDLDFEYTPNLNFIGIDSVLYSLSYNGRSTLPIRKVFRVGPIRYVDSDGGSDSNSGEFPNDAWKTVNKVNTTVLEPGTTILFKRGGQWREQLHTQGGLFLKPITYSSFGEGPKPLLLGSKDGRSTNWTETSPGSHIWKTELYSTSTANLISNSGFETNTSGWTPYYNSSHSALMTVSRDAAIAYSGSSSMKIEITNSGTSSSDIQIKSSILSVADSLCYAIQFYAKASQNITTPGNGVSLAQNGSPYGGFGDINTPLKISTTWSLFTIPVQATRTGSDAVLRFYFGNITHSTMIWVDDISIRNVNCDALITHDVGNIIFDQGQFVGIKKWLIGDLQSDLNFLYDQSQVYLFSIQNPLERFKEIEMALTKDMVALKTSYTTIENLDLRYGGRHGVSGTPGVSNAIIRNCDFSYIGGGLQNYNYGHPVRLGNAIQFWNSGQNNIIEGNWASQIYDAAYTPQGNGGLVFSNFKFLNNYAEKSEYCFEYFNRPAGARSENIEFSHNTCMNMGKGWGSAQRPDPNAADLMLWSNPDPTQNMRITGNVFQGSSGGYLRFYIPWGGIDTLMIDSNAILPDPYLGKIAYWSIYGSMNIFEPTSTGLRDYQTLSHMDLNSILSRSVPDSYVRDSKDICVPYEGNGNLYCLGQYSAEGSAKRDINRGDQGWHRK